MAKIISIALALAYGLFLAFNLFGGALTARAPEQFYFVAVPFLVGLIFVVVALVFWQPAATWGIVIGACGPTAVMSVVFFLASISEGFFEVRGWLVIMIAVLLIGSLGVWIGSAR